MSVKLALIIIGVVLEVVGLLLTASPELAPRARRGVAAIQRLGAKVEARTRRLLKRPKNVTVSAGAAAEFALAGRVSAHKSVPDDADVERKLSFLLEQAVESQQRLNKLEYRVSDIPGEWRKDIEDTRSALEERIAHELEQARELFIGRRLIGLTCIASGSLVLAVVNLL